MAASPSPSPDADLVIGSVLDGRYRIDAVLGSGGMGRVYRGEHTGIGRAVAIKVLHADLSRNREAAQRFQREALASGRLDHPNIVGVSDFGIVDAGPCYLVMEALEGESLGERLTREKRIPWHDAITILRGVLQGLRHAHDRGVVHRDIKPDNVFLARKDGETVVKILDFGIAKLYAGSPDDPASTRAGLTVGTPAYLSPEQAVGGEIKPTSDLYSTTILLFEMITGRPPFEDKDPLAMLGAHVSRTPPRLAEVAPDLDIPLALEAVVEKGLQKTVADRIASANEYIALLDDVVVNPRGSGPALSFLGQPVGGEALGVAPTAAALTPVPGLTPLPASMMTPAPVAPTTPVPGTLTTGHAHSPVPGSIGVAAPTAILPASTRPVALADAPMIPRRWIKLAAIILAAIVALAIIAVLAKGGSDDAKQPANDPAARPRPGAAAPVEPTQKPKGSPVLPPAPAPMMVTAPVDKETRLKSLLHDLEHGKTCADRKAAIPGLVELGDPAAIANLKRARYRMRGGVLGFGDSNTNACLKASAEAAIKSLGGTLK